MAENIIVYFSEQTDEKIMEVFEDIAEHMDDTWYIPSNKNYLIMIYPYDDFLREYEDIEQLKIIEVLGSVPKISFCMAVRRIQSNQACDFIKKLLIEKLSKFHYVVDDNMDRIWTKAEVEMSKAKFLTEYYY